jgi:hypothetical protein
VKPFVLARVTSIVVVCPGSNVTVPGVAFNVKLDAAVTVSEVEETAFDPFTVTVMGPVAALVGMTKDTFVAVKLETDAGIVPPPCWFNVTTGVALFAVKFVPVTEMRVPTDAEVGVKLVMVGGGATVKATPLLATPPTVTTTFPVVAPLDTATVMLVALQHVGHGVADVPLKVTVLVPWLEPKFVPAIVTNVPTAPEVGDRLVIFGAVPPLLAALNAASIAPQGSLAPRDALAETAPAVVSIRSSTISFVFGSAGTNSLVE